LVLVKGRINPKKAIMSEEKLKQSNFSTKRGRKVEGSGEIRIEK